MHAQDRDSMTGKLIGIQGLLLPMTHSFYSSFVFSDYSIAIAKSGRLANEDAAAAAVQCAAFAMEIRSKKSCKYA
jgi:hypothetical protein